MKKNLFLLGLITMSLISCESSTYEEISGVVENPTYNKNIKPIFEANCVSCHYTNNPDNISVLTDYAKTRQSVEFGSTLEYINAGIMPKNSSKLPNVTIELITKWKANGFPEN